MFRRFLWWFYNKKYCRSCHKMTKHSFSVFYNAPACKNCHRSNVEYEVFLVVSQLQNNIEYEDILTKNEYSRNFLKFVNENYTVIDKLFLSTKTGEVESLDDLFFKFLKYRERRVQYKGETKDLHDKIVVLVFIVSLITLITLFVII